MIQTQDTIKQDKLEAIAAYKKVKFTTISARIDVDEWNPWLVVNIDGAERATRFDITEHSILEKLIELFDVFQLVESNLEWYD